MTEIPAHGLVVERLFAGYGEHLVLRNISLEVKYGEVAVVIGHNGAGKTTLLRSVFGLLPLRSGIVRVDGGLNRGHGWGPLVAYSPQGHRVFPTLSVKENLEVAGAMYGRRALEGIRRAVSFFPQLRGRLRERAGVLSGGERQILNLASGLIRKPRVWLFDEPCLGLSPGLVKQVLAWIRQIADGESVAVLLVEHKVKSALAIADKVCAIRRGAISFYGDTENLVSDDSLRKVLL